MDSTPIYYPLLWLITASIIAGVFVVSGGMAYFRRQVAGAPGAPVVLTKQFQRLDILRRVLWMLALLLGSATLGAWLLRRTETQQQLENERKAHWPVFDPTAVWESPDPFLAETDENAKLIAYGRDLIARTQDYFGENGLVRPGSINSLNCQSCHLDAGSKPFGNNYSAVFSTYPQKRARSGTLETIPKRVNDCFERSMNGQALDTTGREMKAIVAYIEWLGTGVPQGVKPKGSGLVEVPFLDRPADPARGKIVYDQQCASCHGADGQGLPMPNSARDYPPLWGDKSYNEAAGLFRMSRFAGYVKANMPFGASYQAPQLTDEQAWDVAAYVNSQPRPKHPFLKEDWPDISKKPYDHPFGPYKDTFPEYQHKFGPYQPIIAYYKK
jgi:thiosulfate dehydrogenase